MQNTIQINSDTTAHTISPAMNSAKNLVETLSSVMAGVIEGKIDIDTAKTTCIMSSEMLKILEFVWIVGKEERKTR